MTIVTIFSEITAISTSLPHLQMIIFPKQDFVRTLDSRPELAHTLDTALIGCMVIFGCLDEEIRDIIAKRSQTGALSWKGKANLFGKMRNYEKCSIASVDSRTQSIIAETLKRMKSLRLSNPEVDVPALIYIPDDRRSIYSIRKGEQPVNKRSYKSRCYYITRQNV